MTHQPIARKLEIEPMKVSKNKVVTIVYRLTNGTAVVETNEEFEPLQYLHGHRCILPFFEEVVDGMMPGEETSVTLSPANAYGLYDPNLIVKINRNDFRTEDQLATGDVIETSEGKEYVVTDLDETIVSLDGNHPLAGQTIEVWVRVLAVRNATDEELQLQQVIEQKTPCGSGCCC